MMLPRSDHEGTPSHCVRFLGRHPSIEFAR